jgi:hypothetical protein
MRYSREKTYKIESMILQARFRKVQIREVGRLKFWNSNIRVYFQWCKKVFYFWFGVHLSLRRPAASLTWETCAIQLWILWTKTDVRMKRDNSSQATIENFFEKKRKVSSGLAGMCFVYRWNFTHTKIHPVRFSWTKASKSIQFCLMKNLETAGTISMWSFRALLLMWWRFSITRLQSPLGSSFAKLCKTQLSHAKLWGYYIDTIQLSLSLIFKEAILAYNPKYEKKWDFLGLFFYFEKALSDGERDFFFQETLPFIIETALALPELLKSPIPLLIKHASKRVTLSRHQVRCLENGCFVLLPISIFCFVVLHLFNI